MSNEENEHVGALWQPGGGGCFSNQNSLYEAIFQRHFAHLKYFSVLEVGAGDGSFAKILMDRGAVPYEILDLQRSFDTLNKNLGGRATLIPSTKYRSPLLQLPHDLFVSLVCLSETPDYYRNYVTEEIVTRSRNAFIIDGGQTHIKGWDSYIEGEFRGTFREVVVEDFPRWSCKVYIGKNNYSLSREETL